MNNTQQNNTIATAYDDVPYSSQVFHHCQPNRLHALAKLKGLNPPDLNNARVLEIGCSFGGNLIPHAIQYPNSQIIGIDLSEKQIAVGQQMMAELGLSNVTLIAADISKVNFENIQFDYIICHGIFSWVPEFVQNAILHITQNYLASNGVAFISYNTYPGWHLKEMVKELMQFGTDDQAHPFERIDQAKVLFDDMASLLTKYNSTIHKEFTKIANHIIEAEKYYVAHEYLEEINQPFYLHQFMKKANNYGLGYIADSSVPNIGIISMLSGLDNEPIYQKFNRDVVKVEQYFDFINQRPFRCTLLTHQHNLTDYNIDKYNLCHHFPDLYIKAHLTNVEDRDNRFWMMSDKIFRIDASESRDIIANQLNNSDQPCKISKLQTLADSRNPESSNDFLLILIHQEQSYISYYPTQITPYGEYPKLADKFSRLIRFVSNNPNITKLSNIYGQIITLTPFTSYLAPYLDGTNNFKDLIKLMRNEFKNGNLVLNHNGKPVAYRNIRNSDLEVMIKETLDNLQLQGYFNQY
ncbi:methyltransferase regulatory domain-containing protein [Ursidibacter sp. B-7004-1]